MIADGQGRVIAFRLAPGQVHKLHHAVPLLDHLPGVPKWVVGDRGYTSHAFREHIWNMGARPAIPLQHHEAHVACPDWIYNTAIRSSSSMAGSRNGAPSLTQYEKTAVSFMSVLYLAAALERVKR